MQISALPRPIIPAILLAGAIPAEVLFDAWGPMPAVVGFALLALWLAGMAIAKCRAHDHGSSAAWSCVALAAIGVCVLLSMAGPAVLLFNATDSSGVPCPVTGSCSVPTAANCLPCGLFAIAGVLMIWVIRKSRADHLSRGSGPEERPRRNRIRTLLLWTPLAVLILVYPAAWSYKHLSWWTPAGKNIASTVNGAVAMEYLDPSTSPSLSSSPLAEVNAVKRALSRYYTGGELAQRRRIVADVLWANQSVSSIRLDELTFEPGGATATGQVLINGGYSSFQYTWHLVDTNHGWRVDREDSSCATPATCEP